MDREAVQRRMRASGAARAPVAAWIAGAHALAILHSALQVGLLDAARTPRTPAEIAAAIGTTPGLAADLCAALAAHGILDRDGESYRLSEGFALLTSPDQVVPLPAMVARGQAEARMLATVARPGASYAKLSPDEMLAFARGDSVNPASPLRYGLSFLSHPDLRRIYAAGARHLELGCGVGGNLLTLLNTYPHLTAVGVEFDAALLKVARQRAAELGVADRVEWRQGDARDIADEAAFDTLAWSQYYFPAESRATPLAAAFRALKPGGYLLSSMLPAPPASEEERIGPAGRAYAITRLLYGSWGVPVRDEAELRAEVEAAGFTFVQFLESPQRRRLLARRSPA